MMLCLCALAAGCAGSAIDDLPGPAEQSWPDLAAADDSAAPPADGGALDQGEVPCSGDCGVPEVEVGQYESICKPIGVSCSGSDQCCAGLTCGYYGSYMACKKPDA